MTGTQPRRRQLQEQQRTPPSSPRPTLEACPSVWTYTIHSNTKKVSRNSKRWLGPPKNGPRELYPLVRSDIYPEKWPMASFEGPPCERGYRRNRVTHFERDAFVAPAVEANVARLNSVCVCVRARATNFGVCGGRGRPAGPIGRTQDHSLRPSWVPWCTCVASPPPSLWPSCSPTGGWAGQSSACSPPGASTPGGAASR